MAADLVMMLSVLNGAVEPWPWVLTADYLERRYRAMGCMLAEGHNGETLSAPLVVSSKGILES
jgi:hypothetical protein